MLNLIGKISHFFFYIFSANLTNVDICIIMETYFEINGGNKLYGEIVNQTSKNATLPIMSACLMLDGVTKITNYPQISDVDNMISLLFFLGAKVEKSGEDLLINTNTCQNIGIDGQLAKTMRSSVFLLGSYLSRFKNVMLTLPGGCDIGLRPIDVHISALKQLGVNVSCLGNNVFFDATNAKANKVKLRMPSVGATENIIQFACKLKGTTIIINPAKEPEVVDLCNFLNLAGAKIIGAGTNKITIYGVDSLVGVTYKPIGDRIAAGTIVGAVAMCGGDVTIRNAVPYQNLNFLKKVASLCCQIDIKNDIIHIISDGKLKSIGKIETGYYPDFPTDLQSIMLAISTIAEGETTIIENIFENRFQIVHELIKCGARFRKLSNRIVKIRGVENLKPAEFEAKELRGGAALVLLALIANGKSKVTGVKFIDRGYVQLEKTLTKLGAEIKRCQKEK